MLKQFFRFSLTVLSGGGHAMAQMLEVLRYKPDGHGFDSWWCHWKFSLTILPAELQHWHRLIL